MYVHRQAPAAQPGKAGGRIRRTAEAPAWQRASTTSAVVRNRAAGQKVAAADRAVRHSGATLACRCNPAGAERPPATAAPAAAATVPAGSAAKRSKVSVRSTADTTIARLHAVNTQTGGPGLFQARRAGRHRGRRRTSMCPMPRIVPGQGAGMRVATGHRRILCI